MDKKIFPRWFYFILCAICIGAFVVRLYHVTSPIADWHSWRQVDTAAVARNFLKFDFDLLRPRYDDLSNIQSGFDNPKGYRMVEFPVYQATGAILYKSFHIWSIEVWLRLVSILVTCGSVIVLTLLVARYSGVWTGLFAGGFFAFLPYSIYYGRTILPEPTMVFLSLLSVYLLDTVRFNDDNKKNTVQVTVLFILSLLSGALALLVKPVAGFILLPIGYILLTMRVYKKQWLIMRILYCAAMLFPLWWWRSWITQFPEGIPVYAWLFNGGNIRFKGAWFYWLFSQRIAQLILGYWGVLFFANGMMTKVHKQEGWLMRLFIVGALAYMIIIARGNVQHDYYQILLLPVICIYSAKGLFWIIQNADLSFIMRWGIVITSLLFTIGFSWYTIRSYYWINRPEIVEAGMMADKIIPKDAKVIAPYNGDTTFLYQTNRQGWPIGFDLDKKLRMGAQYYVTVSPTDADTETKFLAETYTVLVRNDRYAIIDLTKKK